jgi:hypothetical protein
MIENLMANLDMVKVNDSIKPNILEGYKKEVTPLNYDPLYEVEKLSTRNEKLDGENHPETGVPFERKIVETPEGEKVGVFPVFDSEFTIKLPEELLDASDNKQFNYCNEKLEKSLREDFGTNFNFDFDEDQFIQILDKETPDGYTWHHNEETGTMELVDSETHTKTAHTGGKVVWGGGSLNR